MKKLIALLLVLTMILSLAACGKKEEPVAPETPEEETEVPEAEVPVDPEVEDIVIEQDTCPRDPFDCLANSYKNLKEIAANH